MRPQPTAPPAGTEPGDPRRGRPGRRGSARRGGFTLLELLIVVAVIAVLIALLVPAVRQAFGSANDAAVSTELTTLEAGLARFKHDYGRNPPSLLNLSVDGGTFADPKTMSTLRSIFGTGVNETQMIASLTQTGIYNAPGPTDDPDFSQTVVLRGAECLVFFLGGLPANSVSRGVPSTELAGFSKNPADPFNVGARGASGNFTLLDKQRRNGPFVAFEPGRLVTPAEVGEGFYFMYLDRFGSQRTPILYTDSDGGRGYPTRGDLPLDSFYDQYGPHPDLNYGFDHEAGAPRSGSVFGDPNGSGPEVAALLNGPYVDAAGTPINPKGHQLISPGPDGVFGVGGTFDGGEFTPAAPGAQGDDNVTNFSKGALGG